MFTISKICFPTWNNEFKLPDQVYSVIDIQNYFMVNIKKCEILAANPSIKIFANRIKN